MRELVLAALPADPPAGDLLLVDFASYALTDVRQLREYINARGGLVTDKGVLLKVAEMYRGRERNALAILAQLGLGPKARVAVMAGNAAREAATVQAAQERLRARMKAHTNDSPVLVEANGARAN
jgi:hypothetical protein